MSGATARELKHNILLQSVNNVKGAVRILECLVDEISGNIDKPKLDDADKNPDQKQISLVSVLTNSPETLNNEADNIRKYCEIIKEMLL